MKTSGPLTTYNRVIARHAATDNVYTKERKEFTKSVLAYFGAGEATFIQRFVQVSDADRTTYVWLWQAR